MELSALSNLSQALVIQNVDVALLAKALRQQQNLGKATVALLEQSAASQSPPRGAAEPGKGSLVDRMA
ncbi:MAG: hypothetical protein JNK49_07440 [Planctomycetes bacterium]|nr:hypothetical protein [Planctomycetota bacterium]